MKEERILESELSLQRPGWTQDNLHAYRDKRFTKIKGQFQTIVKDYFVKTEGMA